MILTKTQKLHDYYRGVLEMEKCIKGIKDYYNVTADNWAEEWYPNETMLPLLKKFISLFPKNPRILDAGCGAGYESMRLFNLGAEMVGIDISEKSIEIARNKNPDCKFELMDCMELDYSLGRFDGIVALALIVHIIDNKLNIIFNNFYNILNNNGFLFLAFVEGEGFSERRSYLEIEGEKYNREFYLHQSSRIIEIAKITGFKFSEEWFLNEPMGQWKFVVFKKEI